MNEGDRVQLKDKNTKRIRLGTVKTVSDGGTVGVQWDHNITEVDQFSKAMAKRALKVVEGDAALPRHAWNVNDVTNIFCDRCLVEQSDENEHAPCRG